MREAILIVDDDTQARRVLQEMLNREGYETKPVAGALEAMMVACLNSRPIDVALIGAGLQGIDSGRLADKLRQAFPETAVIFIAPEGVPAQSGGGEVLTLARPFEREALVELVRRALSGRSVRKEPARSSRPAPEAQKTA